MSYTYDKVGNMLTGGGRTGQPPIRRSENFLARVVQGWGQVQLLPESWTALSWKILIYHPWPDEGIFHEEVEVHGEPDRIHSATG